MNTTFDIDPKTGMRTVSVIFERADGSRFTVDTDPGENVQDALQRSLHSRQSTAIPCSVEIVEAGKRYRANYGQGQTEEFVVIL
jgi:hypothetical protein